MKERIKSCISNLKHLPGVYLMHDKDVLIGFNDLESCHPNILSEWSERNNKLPSEYFKSSHAKVWWKCSKGHEWKAMISNRVVHSQKCPICQLYNITSFPERAIYFYVCQYFLDVTTQLNIDGYKYDIFIPSLNTIVEYDGVYFHKKRYTIDNQKSGKCFNRKLKLIRIREKGLQEIDGCINILRTDTYSYESLNQVITQLLTELGITEVVDKIDVQSKVNEIEEFFQAKTQVEIFNR